MGIKNFSKIFEPNKEFKWKEFDGKIVAVDAMIEIYKSVLAMSKVDSLTDSNGKITSHINTILLGMILKLKKYGADQIWVFDYSNQNKDNEFHNPLKMQEILKRRKKRNNALVQIENAQTRLQNGLFSDSEEEMPEVLYDDVDNDVIDNNVDNINNVFDKDNTFEMESKEEIMNKIEKKRKESFILEQYFIRDIQFILNCLNIPWIESPRGFESEQICALLTRNRLYKGKTVDYVFTPDADALLFNASKIIKKKKVKSTMKLYEYNLDLLLQENIISLDTLRRIGIALGSDFAPKTPRIGDRSIVNILNYRMNAAQDLKDDFENSEFGKEQKKMLQFHKLENKDFEKIKKEYTKMKTKWDKILNLNDEQENALKTVFDKKMNEELNWFNIEQNSFKDKEKNNILLDWLINEKKFNETRIKNAFKKASILY